jgi:MFS family permease
MTAPEAGRRTRYAGAWRSGPLSVPAFRLLTAGQFTSTLGDCCYAVALPWLVLSAHGSTTLLGTLLACYGVPRTVLIPAGGILADRLSPRTTMLAADTARCAFLAVFTVLAARHTVSLTVLGPSPRSSAPARGCSSRRRSRPWSWWHCPSASSVTLALAARLRAARLRNEAWPSFNKIAGHSRRIAQCCLALTVPRFGTIPG